MVLCRCMANKVFHCNSITLLTMRCKISRMVLKIRTNFSSCISSMSRRETDTPRNNRNSTHDNSSTSHNKSQGIPNTTQPDISRCHPSTVSKAPLNNEDIHQNNIKRKLQIDRNVIQIVSGLPEFIKIDKPSPKKELKYLKEPCVNPIVSDIDHDFVVIKKDNSMVYQDCST